jgi:hypothetical protein
MLSLNEFIEKYLGVFCGNTPENYGECVGLASLWIDNLGLRHIWGHARDIFNNASIQEYKKVKNAPNLFPDPGDIIIWSGVCGGGFGHIAIVVSSNPSEDSFTVFEQNNPGNIPGLEPEISTYTNWYGVIGWLKPLVLLENASGGTTGPQETTSTSTSSSSSSSTTSSTSTSSSTTQKVHQGGILKLIQLIIDILINIFRR